MSNEYEIVRRVYQAKADPDAADRLIRDYMPFIRAETAGFLQRPPAESDDELSVAMMAFHEAITGYAKNRGAFLSYAAVLIRSRLIDHQRREKRHRGNLSLDASTAEEDDRSAAETLVGDEDHGEKLALRDGTRVEIMELTRKLAEFGITLTDVADDCPRQKRTIAACQRVLDCAAGNPEIIEELLRTKRLPSARLCELGGLERKTLERHRKYIIALLLIYSNGFEIIRGHLKQVMKGGTAK